MGPVAVPFADRCTVLLQMIRDQRNRIRALIRSPQEPTHHDVLEIRRRLDLLLVEAEMLLRQ